jgi:hypothetical protein
LLWLDGEGRERENVQIRSGWGWEARMDETNLSSMHDMLRHASVKDRAVNEVRRNLLATETGFTDVRSGIDQLSEMDFAVFLGDEADQVRPGRHSEGGASDV